MYFLDKRVYCSTDTNREAVTQRCCVRPATLLKKRLTQVFSCEFPKISKNTFCYRTPLVAAFLNATELRFQNHYLELEIKIKNTAS